jgi:hypothetical protein
VLLELLVQFLVQLVLKTGKSDNVTDIGFSMGRLIGMVQNAIRTLWRSCISPTIGALDGQHLVRHIPQQPRNKAGIHVSGFVYRFALRLMCLNASEEVSATVSPS